MKVTNIIKIDKLKQHDLSTETENFYINVNDINLLVHNSPAVFAGIDPSDGAFFVAKKGIFNKNPKVYKSVSEVKADTSGDLAEKLTVAFNELRALGIKGVVQGDMLYTKKDLKSVTIDGTRYITFHPNTIVYAVPADSDIGKKIAASKMGIVFHTAYSGSSFENMVASYDVDSSKFKKSNGVWYTDALLRDLSGQATLTADETAALNEIISRAGKIFNKINSTTLKALESNPEFASTLETFNNTLVRRGETVKDTTKHVQALIKYAQDKFDKESASRSSAAGKAAVEKRREAYMSFFNKTNKESLALIYELQNAIVEAKLIIIKKLGDLKKIDTFIKTKDGFKVTGEEGYVAIDKLKNGALKLVDRMSFSYANFSPDVIKGWDK